ncbi:glycosyltransferase family 4 protein [Actinacidiphila soli]|uniref:glycosyltransferase family 4 protein n=1 Tax=Actinacidiphila soli TaxID=2487275 RepID=UPI000FCC01B6|nr:glycosyltransferase family 4 protein [Actinacidiphila soli]
MPDISVESDSRGRRLHVALVHSVYGSESPSGENQAVLDQAQALRCAGHLVSTVAAHTDELQTTTLYKLRAGLTVATGLGRTPLAQLARLCPDVVHVHNLFPNFGRSWVSKWNGAIVATLHNYRPLCAVGTLHRDGALCTRCPDGERWSGLKLGCYRGSRAATLPLSWANRRGVSADPLLRRADRVVVLSERSRDLYVRFGLPESRLSLVPNFVSLRDPCGPAESAADEPDDTRCRWLFVGRLSEEKGILQLLRNWPAGEPLDVIGSGPLDSACRAVAPRGVRLLGALPHQGLTARMPRYTGLVLPSVCPESAMPLVCQEALAAGLPVLARAGSAAADSVCRDGTGAVYRGDDDLPGALATARERFPLLREHCRHVHAARFTAKSWIRAMDAVYREAVRSWASSWTPDSAEPAC